MRGTVLAAVLAAAVVAFACGGTPAPGAGPAGQAGNAGKVEFASSQGNPINEQEGMRKQVLAGFQGSVDFNAAKTGAQFSSQILAEHQTGKSTIDVYADLHGDLVALQAAGALEDLTPLLQRLSRDRHFDPTLLKYGRLGTDRQYYIPWLQATYLLVVNKKALPYLPRGADVNALTYDQLIAWGESMLKATGERKIGLPLAPGVTGGLLKRFVQGYAYPSYTGTEVTGFKSPEAVQMWQSMKRLWSVTNPQSTSYSQMQDPLESGEVWVAWDHQARLINALRDQPDQFIAVPAPSGPKGLGYMSAVAGLAIPKGAPNQRGAEALIDYLTRPENQGKAGAVLSFFPVLSGVTISGSSAPPGLAAEATAASRQTAARNAIPALLPVGLGGHADQFDSVYYDTFLRIALRNEDIQSVLGDEAGKLQQQLDAARAPCWPPDPKSSGTCQVG
jgi:multiple sugar transport system substrate-binding protein